MLEYLKLLKVNHFQITLDGHRDRHNKVRFLKENNGSYDKIISNIKKCINNRIAVTCRINLSKETINEDLTNIINDFSDLNENEKELIDFSFNQVWQEKTDLNNDILDIISVFKANNLKTSYNKYNDSVRESCYGDKKNQATINFNGDVYKCTARDFKPENREGVLMDDGTIEWNDKYYQRMESKFNNPPCLACNILPICNGSCTQHALDNIGKDYCVHDFDENKKIDIIREKLLYAIN